MVSIGALTGRICDSERKVLKFSFLTGCSSSHILFPIALFIRNITIILCINIIIRQLIAILEEPKTLFCSSIFLRVRLWISSKCIANLGTSEHYEGFCSTEQKPTILQRSAPQPLPTTSSRTRTIHQMQ